MHKVVFFGDNILDDCSCVKTSCDIQLANVVILLKKFGAECDMLAFINSVRRNDKLYLSSRSEPVSCLDERVKNVTDCLMRCAASGATISVTTGSLYSTLGLPDSCAVEAITLSRLMDDDSMLGNFFQAALTAVASCGVLATHLLGVQVLSPALNNADQPSLASDTLGGSEIQMTLFDVNKFEYSQCFHTCSIIHKTILAMDKVKPCSSDSRRLSLLCLSPEANPVRLWDVFRSCCFPSQPDECCYHTWLDLVLPVLKANPVFPPLLGGQNGDELVSSGGYHLLLVTFGEIFHSWAKAETKKCLSRIEMPHSEKKTVRVASRLGELTKECEVLMSRISGVEKPGRLCPSTWDAFCAKAEEGVASKFSDLHMERLCAVYTHKVLRCEIGPAQIGKWFMATGYDEVVSGFYDSEDDAFDAGTELALVPRRVFTAAVGEALPASMRPSAPLLDDLLLVSTHVSEHTIPFFNSIEFGPLQNLSPIHE